MKTKRSELGFTLGELVAATGVIAVLASFVYPVFVNGSQSAGTIRCLSNLHQIGLAAQMYYAEYDGPPMTALPVSLQDYAGDADVFVCPNDPEGEDSYSAFFAGRYRRASEVQFVVGCPRHRAGKKQAVLLGKAKSQVAATGEVRHNGEQVALGEFVEGGVLEFAAGSRVDIQDGVSIAVLASMHSTSGFYTVVWVSDENCGSVDVTVPSGSRFEVLTPSVVAAVRGTKFRVTVASSSTGVATWVQVYEGEVLVEGRVKARKAVVKAGQSITMGCSTDKCKGRYPGPWPKKPKKSNDD